MAKRDFALIMMIVGMGVILVTLAAGMIAENVDLRQYFFGTGLCLVGLFMVVGGSTLLDDKEED